MAGYFGRIGVFAYCISNCSECLRFSNGFSNLQVGLNFAFRYFPSSNSTLLAEI